MKIWYDVFIKWSDGDFIYDAIKGTDTDNALENSWENWSDASYIMVGGEHIE